MADVDAIEARTVYYIPENFADGSGVLGGAFPLRNFVEGCLMALPLAYLGFQLPLDLAMKIGAVFALSVPLLLLGCIGINGDCVSEFLLYFYKFHTKKRTVRYNPRVKLEYTGELKITRMELPKDKLARMLKNLNREDKKESTESDRYFDVEKFIAFEDDLKLEKKLLASVEKGKRE